MFMSIDDSKGSRASLHEVKADLILNASSDNQLGQQTSCEHSNGSKYLENYNLQENVALAMTVPKGIV
ncbi:hypothetical protein WISP_144252 [Willisornis vidua]|uniref:Uncharacterized protein n=1 Tax=Willisornis vidua TaxID=1566151 RepID=A0ABQ9CNT2_9PASS|nr:hypothetical protein WISP_144252 [Willisornis vidua]